MSSAYAANDRMALAEFNRTLSLDSIISERCQSLGALHQQIPGEINRLLMLMLIDLAKSFSISNNLTEAQVEDAAAEILVTYYWLSLEDISLFLHQVKKSHFGTVYSLDTNKLLYWLSQYDIERTMKIVDLREREHQHLTGDPFSRSSDETSIRAGMNKIIAERIIAAGKKKK